MNILNKYIGFVLTLMWFKVRHGNAAIANTLILSEVLPNPSLVSDSVGEYIELFNPTSISADLTGYEVCDLTKCTTLSGTVSSGNYYMLCRNTEQYSSCNIKTTVTLNNSDGDTITLKDANGNQLDSTTYESATNKKDQGWFRSSSDTLNPDWQWTATDAFTPGSGSLEVRGLPTTSSPTMPPPSSPSPTPTAPAPEPTECAEHVLISQVLYDEPGSANNTEWIELYNPTDGYVSLGGWSLNLNNGDKYVIPSGSGIAAGGRYILGKSGFKVENGFEADITDLSITLINSGDILALKDASNMVVDEVGWETSPWTSVFASDGNAIRRIDGTDTGNDASDWESDVVPIAGGKFYACSAEGGGVGNGCWGDHLLISKVYYDTTTGEADTTHEWVELFNPTKDIVDLTGWTISDNSDTYTIQSGSIAPTGHFVLGKSGFQLKYGVAPDVSDLPFGLNNGGDQLYLRDGSSALVDFLAWEGGATGCGTECEGWDIMAGDGQYLVRSTPHDTDSPTDWARVTTDVIPRAGRPTCGTPSCVFPTETLTVTAVNIGQGDMSLVATPNKFLVGDTGESTWNTSYDADHFDNWFRQRHGERCTHIDYVVISHFQVDHIGYVGYGGLWKLHNMYDYTIEKTLLRDYQNYVGSRSGTYTNWVDYLDNQGGAASLNVEIAVPGTGQVDMGHGVIVNVVQVDGKTPLTPAGCRPEILDYFPENASNPPSENDYSVAFVVSLGDFDAFIGGDTSGEDYISSFNYKYHDTETCLRNDVGEVDVYRVNHHGSDHSSNQVFINTLSPQVAIISVGDANPYGHPRQEVMDRLNTVANLQVYMTERGDTNTSVYDAKVVGACDVTVASNGTTFMVSGTGVPGDIYTSGTRRRRFLRGKLG